jgi:hypothetical protein
MPNMLNGAEYHGAPDYATRVLMMSELRADLGLTQFPSTVVVVPPNAAQRCGECWSPNSRNAVARVQLGSDYPTFMCGEHLRTLLARRYAGEYRCVHPDCDMAWVRLSGSFSPYTVQGHEAGDSVAICSAHEHYYRSCEECGAWYNRHSQTACCEPSPRCSCCGENERTSGAPLTSVRNVMVCCRCVPRYYPECVECNTRDYYDSMVRVYVPNGHYGAAVTRVCVPCSSSMANGVPAWHHCSQHGVACRLGALSYEEALILVDTPANVLCCDGSSSTIHGYSYRPTLAFKGTGPMFYGAEIEVTTRNLERAARIANRDFKGHVYLKTDGSISGQGFEMVTHPASYDWWMAEFQWDVLARLKDAGASAKYTESLPWSP